jgi:hypothetical protein
MRRGLTLLLAFAGVVPFAFLAAFLGGFLGAGCYRPDVANGGYSCSVERPDCPSGFVCVGNRCVDESGPLDSGPSTEPDDLSMSANPSADMTMMTPIDSGGQSTDMSKPADDMAKPNQCSDGACLFDDDCCPGRTCYPIFFIGRCGD